MHRFKDTKGRSWDAIVTVATDKRVRALTGVSLFRLHEGLGDSVEDVLEKAVDILFAVIEPQAKSAGISDDDFGSSLDGETLRAAWDALLDEAHDFFRHWNPAQAAALRKARELSASLLQRATAALDAISFPTATA